MFIQRTTLSFYHGLKTAPKPGACVLDCASEKIFERFLHLGHQLGLGVAGRVVHVFLNYAQYIPFHLKEFQLKRLGKQRLELEKS